MADTNPIFWGQGVNSFTGNPPPPQHHRKSSPSHPFIQPIQPTPVTGSSIHPKTHPRTPSPTHLPPSLVSVANCRPLSPKVNGVELVCVPPLSLGRIVDREITSDYAD
ncbi:unnamed protein product [Arctogadus glacialis]